MDRGGRGRPHPAHGRHRRRARDRLRGLDRRARGSPRLGSLGGTVGSLSPDGRRVVAGAGEADVDAGVTPGLWLWRTDQGQVRDVAIGDVTGPVTDIWWADDERYFVVVSTPDAALGRAVRTLYECTVTAMACQTRLEDESGTLAVPSS